MARIRTIKPEFWKHEDLSELPPETHMLAAALLNYADDEGYFNANPKLIQAECCPLREDSTNVRRSLESLSKIGYIRLFDGSDGKAYGHIIKFLDHQRVDRPRDSKIKALEASTKDRRKIDEPSAHEWKGMEGNGTGKGSTHGSSANADKPPLKPDYPPEFDSIWNGYPKREGSNPKNKAFSAYKARIKEGATAKDIAAGVSRYYRFCQQKGSVGTEYVMQAVRFFGPSKEFENDWIITETGHAAHQPGYARQSKSDHDDERMRKFLAENSVTGGDGEDLADAPGVETGYFPGRQH